MPSKNVFCGRCEHKYSCKQNFEKHFDTYMIHDQKREDSQKKDEKAAGTGVLIPNVCYKTTGPRICGYYVEEAASYIKLK